MHTAEFEGRSTEGVPLRREGLVSFGDQAPSFAREGVVDRERIPAHAVVRKFGGFKAKPEVEPILELKRRQRPPVLGAWHGCEPASQVCRPFDSFPLALHRRHLYPRLLALLTLVVWDEARHYPKRLHAFGVCDGVEPAGLLQRRNEGRGEPSRPRVTGSGLLY